MGEYGWSRAPTEILSPFAIAPHFCQITHTPFSIATSSIRTLFCITDPSATLLLHCTFYLFLGCSRPSSQLCCLSLFFGMNSELGSSADGDRGSDSGGSGRVLDIYPLCCYYFGSKDPILLKDETLADRILRMKSKSLSLRFCFVGHCFLFFFLKLFLCRFLKFLFSLLLSIQLCQIWVEDLRGSSYSG